MAAQVLGKVVRYVNSAPNGNKVHVPALVLSVDSSGVASLVVFNPASNGGQVKTNVSEDELTLAVGTWHQAEAEK